MRKIISSPIGFADSEFVCFEKENDELVVIVKAWNEVKLELVFTNVLGLIDRNIGDISNIVIEDEASLFVDEVVALAYDQIPSQHNYMLYQFLDLDDQPVLEIVATQVDCKIIQGP